MLRVTVCSEFFCDPAMWVTLEQDILPGLLSPSRPLMALCIGCGPGLEPYGLATILDDMNPPGGWHVTAFDFDETAIATARAGGPFPPRDLRYVDPAERPRFFTETNDGYTVRPELRQKIDFSVADLRTADLGSNHDLILYRNVEPFFSPQENLIHLRRIFDALRPGGTVFLSSVDRCTDAETLGFTHEKRGFLRRPATAMEPAQ